MATSIGIPYAQANDDGSVTCPECAERFEGLDESQRTAEDAITKGAGRVYAEHYASEHTAEPERPDTTNDPRHYTRRDGTIRPVGGTHERGEVCATCAVGREPLRVMASKYGIGALVTWKYGDHGLAHGRVIGQGRTRLQVFWHCRRARGVWIAAKRILGTRARWNDCEHCREGR